MSCAPGGLLAGSGLAPPAPVRDLLHVPAPVADELVRSVRAGAIDGLNLNPNAVPDGFDDVVERLVPARQDRGVYRTAYEGTTLRENLGVLSASVAAMARA